jgi:transporter family protein
MWVLLGVLSSFFLGGYDILKKLSLRDNAVIPVLFWATFTSGLIFLPMILMSFLGPLWTQDNNLYVLPDKPVDHLFFFLKAIIVGTSWIFSYFALKHLPITIVTPIRSTGPIWTLIGALIIYNEQLTPLQWAGLITTLLFFYLFSFSGRKEGISFRTNKWVLFIILGTLTGAISGLYDKYLLQRYDKLVVQSWFSVYMVAVMLLVYLFIWYPRRQKLTPFTWRWTIPLIGIVLSMADFAYFFALSSEDSLISLLSTVRRGSVLFSFLFGALVFKEKNIFYKTIILAGILTGIIMIILGTY